MRNNQGFGHSSSTRPPRQGAPWEGVWCAQPYTFLDRRGVRTVGDTGFGNGGGRERHLEILGDAGNS